MTETAPAERELGTPARIYLLAVAAFCAASFAYVGVRFTAMAKGVDIVEANIVMWVVVALVMMMPLAAPALMPPNWPRVATWLRRACALYTPFPILLSINALRYNLEIQQQGNEMAPVGIAIAGLATAGCIGSLGVMLWPDLRRLARHLRGA